MPHPTHQPRSPYAVAGPPTPTAPFPISVSGPIVRGFGRGSAELGIPTANIPLTGLSVGGHEELASGVYYGWVGVSVDLSGEPTKKEKEKEGSIDGGETGSGAGGEELQIGVGEGEEIRPVAVPGGTIFPAVLSLGYNPFYKNTVRSLEVHVLHRFQRDFYGARMNLVVCGFVREEGDYVSREALVEDIRVDCEVARRSLGRVGYREVLRGWWGVLTDFSEVGEGGGGVRGEEAVVM